MRARATGIDAKAGRCSRIGAVHRYLALTAGVSATLASDTRALSLPSRSTALTTKASASGGAFYSVCAPGSTLKRHSPPWRDQIA